MCLCYPGSDAAGIIPGQLVLASLLVLVQCSRGHGVSALIRIWPVGRRVVNSPLVFNEAMTGPLKVYARANRGCVVSPFIIGGAIGPVTPPALIAQAHAEAMACIA